MGVLTNSAKLIEKIQSIKSVVTGSSAPSNPSTGDLWYDTTSTVKALKMYDGTNWLIMGPELVSLTQAQYDALPAAEKNNGKYYLITDGNGTVVAGGISTTQPSTPSTGDIYYDTTNNIVKVYNGTTWIEVGGSDDSKTKTFVLSGTSGQTNLDIATEAYEWYMAGKNPIMLYNGIAYELIGLDGSQLSFQPTKRTHTQLQSYHTMNGSFMALMISNSAVIGISVSSLNMNFLDLSTNYTVPYTPQYNGSPATKKYVDDLVGDVETLLAAI